MDSMYDFIVGLIFVACGAALALVAFFGPAWLAVVVLKGLGAVIALLGVTSIAAMLRTSNPEREQARIKRILKSYRNW